MGWFVSFAGRSYAYVRRFLCVSKEAGFSAQAGATLAAWAVALLMTVGCAAVAAPPDQCDDDGCVVRRDLFVDPTFSVEERALVTEAVAVWDASLHGSANVHIVDTPEPGNP